MQTLHTELFRLFCRSDPVFDERIPLVAVGALPEQLGAAIAAAHADMRIHVEDGVSSQLDVALHERALEVEARKDLPDGLMQRQRVGVMHERLEQQFERSTRVISGLEMPGKSEPCPP